MQSPHFIPLHARRKITNTFNNDTMNNVHLRSTERSALANSTIPSEIMAVDSQFIWGVLSISGGDQNMRDQDVRLCVEDYMCCVSLAPLLSPRSLSLSGSVLPKHRRSSFRKVSTTTKTPSQNTRPMHCPAINPKWSGWLKWTLALNL